MKRLSLLVAASALLVAATATTAQAQVVISGPGAQVTVPTAVIPLEGTVLVDQGIRRIPQGVNETGRYARFIGDHRLMADEIQFKNRDFQDWKPLETRSKERMLRSVRGNLRTDRHPIADQEVGRLVRFIAKDDKQLHNNMILMNRDFAHFKPIYAPNSGSLMDQRVRGLAATIQTSVQPGRIVAVRSYAIENDPRLMRFY